MLELVLNNDIYLKKDNKWNLFIEGCLRVDDVRTSNWIQGDAGQYFHFSKKDFDKWTGKKYRYNEKLDVAEKGSQLWYMFTLLCLCSFFDQEDDSQ